MKRLAYTFIALVFVLALFPTTVSAHTADDPMVVDLIAGQNMDVGDVRIWNDDANLYVEFILDGDWCLKETHVAVGSSPSEIPMTKKENPIPGKFLYSATYDLTNCENNPEPYVIPLEWEYGDTIAIAAHAAVARPVTGCYEQVWQIGDVEVINAVTGWLENYADEFNWGDPASSTTAGLSLAEYEPAYTTPFIVGTTPTSEFPYNSNYSRGYATNFDVQWAGGMPFGGKLTVSWSPGQSAAEKKVVSDDGGLSAVFTATGTPQPGYGWFLNTYPLVQQSTNVNPLIDGTHTINFKHTQGDGTFWDWIRLEATCGQYETAWGNGNQFAGSNWAMYFNYTVQGQPALVDTLTVPSTGAQACTSNPLGNGETYLLKASGTYNYRTDGVSIADAEWAFRPAYENLPYGSDEWVKGDEPSDGNLAYPSILGLDVSQYIAPDYFNIDWGDFSPAHTYEATITGDGNNLCLKIYDSNYADNSGALSVEVWWMP